MTIIGYCAFAQNLNRKYIISSGSEGGNYDKTADFLINHLNREMVNTTFSNVHSNGSLDNLANLEMLFSDFALVQQNILSKTIYKESKGVKNIEIIAPLFREKLLIYHNDSSNYDSFAKFVRTVTDKPNLAIGFTSKDSYSYKIFIKIAKLLDFPLKQLNVQFENYENLIGSIEKNEIDVIVTFSLEIEELETNSKINKVYFSKNEGELITSRITNTNILELHYQRYTISTYTFLVGLTDKMEEIYRIENKDLSNLIIDLAKNDTSFIGSEISKTINEFKLPEAQTFLKGIPTTEVLKKELGLKTSSNYLFGLILSVSLLLLVFLIWTKFVHLNTIYLHWIRYNHIYFGVLLLLIVHYSCLEIMVWAEKDLYNSLKLKSQILNMSRSDLHLWVVVSNLASNNNGIFPISTVGKLMFSVSFYSIWLGGACIFIVNYLKTQAMKKRVAGLKSITFKGHIVLCGWNSSVANFVDNFIANIKYQVKQKQKFVLVVNDIEKVRSDFKTIESLHDLHKIELIEGDIKNEKVLFQTNVIGAKTVVIFAEDSTDTADEKTLLRALSISRHCRKFKAKEINTSKKDITQDFEVFDVDVYSDSIYIIAEINNNIYQEDLIAADVNEVICSNNYGKNIISQSIINHGISNILDGILNFNAGNEFYTIDLSKKKNKIFVGRTFDELLVMLRGVHVQLVAIKVIYHDSFGNEIIDKGKISSLLKSDGLETGVIINPSSRNELLRTADNDDILVVLAENEMDLIKKIKRLNRLGNSDLGQS